MSYLVNDFLINPVLRQARRFSRNSTTTEQEDNLTTQRQANQLGRTDNVAILFEPNEQSSWAVSGDDMEGTINTVIDRPLVASPVDEEGGLEIQLSEESASSGPATSNTAHRSRSIPLRLSSLRSDRASIDDDVSENPSFTTQERFRNDSPLNSSFSGIMNDSGTSRADTSEAPSRRSTQGGGSGSSNRLRNSSLPEDDGMKEMRRRIIEIQNMGVDSGRKAQMMHLLLTEEYNISQSSLQPRLPARATSPSSFISQERPSTPGSLSSFSFWQSNESATESSPGTASHMAFQLSPQDLKPTYAPLKPPVRREDSEETDVGNGSEILDESVGLEPSLGCQHYKRNVKMQCSTCNRWHTCRFCHDAVEDHTLNRKETKSMLCMLCGFAQDAGEMCINCEVRTAWYYCNICKLWDDDVTKSIYHCDDCGICRVGAGLGKDYMHCKTCGVCILISKEHKCIERASDCDCPICGEYLFNSPQTVVFMKCGHTIHQVCYRELMKTSYKCPLCSQSVVNMETQFRNLDRAIESQPMPPGFNDTQAMVSCNDCYAKSIVNYHWLGLKCAVCDSYNTAQLRIMSEPIQHSGPAEEDIIPGPRAELFMEDMNRQHAAAAAARASRERRELERYNLTPGPSRARRHSHGQVSASTQAAMLRFNPYPVPTRIGRSVSPARGSRFMEDMFMAARGRNVAIGNTGGDDNEEEEEEEEEVDFWGGDGRRRSRIEPEDDADMDEEADETDSDSSENEEDEDEEDDDGDEVDRMVLFGHR